MDTSIVFFKNHQISFYGALPIIMVLILLTTRLWQFSLYLWVWSDSFFHGIFNYLLFCIAILLSIGAKYLYFCLRRSPYRNSLFLIRCFLPSTYLLYICHMMSALVCLVVLHNMGNSSKSPSMSLLFPCTENKMEMCLNEKLSFSYVGGMVAAILASFLYLFKEENVIFFPHLFQDSLIAIRGIFLKVFFDSCRRGLMTTLITLCLRFILKNALVHAVFQAHSFFQPTHSTHSIILSSNFMFSIAFEVFAVASMLHFYWTYSLLILQIFLTRPMEFNQNLTLLLDGLNMHDFLSLEGEFVSYSSTSTSTTSTHPTNLRQRHSKDGTSSSSSSSSFSSLFSMEYRDLRSTYCSRWEEYMNWHHQRFHHVMSKLESSSNNYSNVATQPLVHRPLSQQIGRSLSFIELLSLSKYDESQRKEIFQDQGIWQAIVQSCTSVIDTLTLQLQLSTCQIAAEDHSNKSSAFQVSQNNKHVSKSKQRHSWHADQVVRAHNYCDPFKFSFFTDSRIYEFDPIISWFVSLVVSSRKSNQSDTNCDGKINRFIRLLLNIGFRKSPSLTTKTIFLNSQLCEWCIEALGNLISKSYTEDQKGIVQHTIPAILCSLLACKIAIQEYIRSLTKFRHSSAMLYSDDKSVLGLPETIEYVLDRGIYDIVFTFYEHLEEYTFPPSYARKLQSYVDMTE